MEAVVVDAEVVSDFVHDRDVDLLHDVLEGVTHAQRWIAIDRDAIRERARVGAAALREGDTFVQAEEVGVIGRPIGLDDEDDVVDQCRELARHRLERFGDQLLEFCGRDLNHHSIVPTGA